MSNTQDTEPPFSDPYKDVPQDKSKRLVADIAAEDFMFLRNMRIGRDTLQTTLNLLVYKLIHELKRANILDYSRSDDFELAVAGCRLLLPTALNPNAEAVSNDDGRGTPSPSPNLPSAPQQPADAPIGVAERGRGGRKSAKTKDRKGK